MLWALSISDHEDPFTRLQDIQKHLGKDSFETDCLRSKVSFKAKFGPFVASAIESGMAYNMPYLLSFFCILGGMRFSFPSGPGPYNLKALCLAVICGCCFCDISRGTVLVFTLVANCFHVFIASTTPVGFYRAGSHFELILDLLLPSTIVTFVSFALVGIWFEGRASGDLETYLFLFVVDSIFSCLVLITGSSNTLRRRRDLSFVSVASMATVIAAVGPMSLIFWGERPQSWAWQSLLLIHLSVSCYLWQQTRYAARRLTGCTFLSVGMAIGSMWLLTRGHGYRLVFLPAALSASEIMRAHFASECRTPNKDI